MKKNRNTHRLRDRILGNAWLPLAAFNLFLLAVLSLHAWLNIFPDRGAVAVDPAPPRLAKTLIPSGPITYMHLRNVKFHWDDEIFVRTPDMTVRGEPLGDNRHIDFGYPDSFALNIIGGTVIADLAIVTRLFNTRVFAYPGAPLRNLSLRTLPEEGSAQIELRGQMKFGAWISFTARAAISVDTESNRIVMTTGSISALGLPFARGLMGSVGLTLEKLVALDGSRGVAVRGNNIIIDPMALFPPPRLRGLLDTARLEGETLRITFREQERVAFPARPVRAANDIMLFMGTLQIARMRMIDPVVQIIDITPEDFLEFNTARYYTQITASAIRILESQAVLMYMPDIGKLLPAAPRAADAH
ncbi:MAG TPA: hypothetical protein PLG31_02775 [Spirochaetota bacterium]|nr:hypothetical protein [Spirochaetota bacterium]